MATNTPNINLVKPTLNEYFNLDIQNGNMDIIDAEVHRVDTEQSTKVSKNDFVSKNNFGTTDSTSTATAYKLTLDPAPTAYTEGMNITIVPNVASGASPTVNVNGLGAIPLVNGEGEALSAGDLKVNTPYSFIKVGANFFQRSSGGGGGELNVYCQPTEPTKKEGIWLKTSNKFNDVRVDDVFYFANEWINQDKGLFADIPYNFTYGSASEIGDNIYLFGSNNSSTDYNTAYRYNTVNNTYTKLSTIPYTFAYGDTASVGTNVYLFGGPNGDISNYRYDTLKNTYAKMLNIPYNFMYGKAVTVGTDIHLMGGDYGTNKHYVYDTLTDTYTQVADIPFQFSKGCAVNIGTDIWLLGGTTPSNYNYKYDTLTNTYTKNANVPYQFFQGSMVASGTEIYLLGSNYDYVPSPKINFYKYNTLTNTYVKLDYIPRDFYNGDSVFVNGKIYAMGGGGNYTKVTVFSFTSKQYPEKTFLISRSNDLTGTYRTQLQTPKKQVLGNMFSRLCTGFNDAYLFINGDITKPTAYYGNGSSWVNFRP